MLTVSVASAAHSVYQGVSSIPSRIAGLVRKSPDAAPATETSLAPRPPVESLFQKASRVFNEDVAGITERYIAGLTAAFDARWKRT